MLERSPVEAALRSDVRRRRRSTVLVLGLAGVLLAPGSVYADEPLVRPRNIGGGATTGTILYGNEKPLQPLLSGCRSTNFLFNSASVVFVLNTAISGYAGPVTITGTGASGCESYTLGGGTVTLTLNGTNQTTKSTLTCPTLSGGYTRVLSHMTLILGGNCTVNRFAQGIVHFVSQLEVVPIADGGASVTAPITSAMTAGAFAIAPA